MPLNPNQLKFAQLSAGGMNKRQAYREAYPKCGSEKAASTKSQLLWSDPRVVKVVEDIRKASSTVSTLSVREKREFLARTVRCNVQNLSEEDADLVESIKKSYDKDGNFLSEDLRLGSKLKAIEIDNRLAGHNEPEEHKVDVGGGVMLVPVGGASLDEWEKEAVAQQEALKDKQAG